jgi:GTP-binding protein HflX
VGFVRHLPTQLIEAFRSTLEEVADADLLVHVVDGSHPDPEGQLTAVREVLGEIDVKDLPELVVVNKVDAADPDVVDRILRREPKSIAVSAWTGEGIEQLLDILQERLPRPDIEVDVLVPYSRGDVVHKLHSHGEVLLEEHLGEGTRVRARVRPGLAAELTGFAVVG